MRHNATEAIKGDVVERQSALESKTHYNEIEFAQIFGAEKTFLTGVLKDLCSVIVDSAKEDDVPTMIEHIKQLTDIIYSRIDEIHFAKKHVEFISDLIIKERIADVLLQLFEDGAGEEQSYIALESIEKLSMVDPSIAALFVTTPLLGFLFSAPQILLQFLGLAMTMLPSVPGEMCFDLAIFQKLCDVLPQIPPKEALNVWITVASHNLSIEQISTIISLLPKSSDPDCLYRLMRLCGLFIEKDEECIPQLLEEGFIPALCSLWGNPGLKMDTLRFWEMVVSKEGNAKPLILENNMFPFIMEAVDSEDIEESIIGVRFVHALLPECLELLLSDDYFDLIFAILYAAIESESDYSFKLECTKLLTDLVCMDPTFAEALMLRNFCVFCENVFGSDEETLVECSYRIFELIISEVEKNPEYQERFRQYWAESSLSEDVSSVPDDRMDMLMERAVALLE